MSRVEEMVLLESQGRDIWTGKPLTGADAQNWRQTQHQLEETPPELSDTEVQEINQARQDLAWSSLLLRKSYWPQEREAQIED